MKTGWPTKPLAARARVAIQTRFNDPQRAFLGFVLAHYVSVGVEELDRQELTSLLRLRYHYSLADAVADLGGTEKVGQAFVGFQRHLYELATA